MVILHFKCAKTLLGLQKNLRSKKTPHYHQTGIFESFNWPPTPAVIVDSLTTTRPVQFVRATITNMHLHLHLHI